MPVNSEEPSTTGQRISELTARREEMRPKVASTNIGEWLRMFREREALEKLLGEGDR
jgi:hypothetical protein